MCLLFFAALRTSLQEPAVAEFSGVEFDVGICMARIFDLCRHEQEEGTNAHRTVSLRRALYCETK